MGYIKKLKNNELVGGTDKTTIYPVTSTEAVFEEVIKDGESNFKSQKFLNNNITGDRINKETITDDNIAVGTITKRKLTPQVQTMLDEGQKKALTPKGNYNPETEYEALDLVFDPVTNSSYISLQTPNVGHPVDENAEGYEEGWWEKTLDGTAVNTAQATINAKVGELDAQVDQAIEDARQELQDATDAANGAAEQAMSVVANKVANAQIGYFECNTATGTALKQTTFDYIGTGDDKSYYTIPAAGSNVKIKMQHANTALGIVELQFGTNTATRKQLIYNGEPASNSNSWDDGEVISIYYDNTYNNGVGAYQASNAQGGGSAVGKKKLTGATGYITTNGDSIGAYNSNSSYRYIKYPVNSGDVIKISGKGGDTPRLWAIADANESIISRAEVHLNTTDLVLTMPEEAKWIVINNDYSAYPNYEWYYAKAGSVGAHEVLTEAYLYRDLKTLAVGQVYRENEAVKTSDKQLLRVTKGVKAMNIIDTIAVGDLKTYGTDTNASTYKALKEVKVYNGTETEGLYAIGRPSLVTITVDSSSLAIEEDTDISITIGGVTNTITITAAASETKAADIAALIAAAFTNIEGWVLTDNEDGTLTLKCNTTGNNTISVSSNTGETGLLITSSIVIGNISLNQYNNGSWEDVSLAAFAEDYADVGVTDNTKMWQKLSIDNLVLLATVQNTLVKTAKAESISYDNSQSGLTADNVQDAVDEVSNNSLYWEKMSLYNADYPVFIISNSLTNPIWTSANGATSILLKVNAGDRLKIVGNGNNTGTDYAFLKNNTIVYQQTPAFAEGYTHRERGSATIPFELDVPSDAEYLWIMYQSGGNIKMPEVYVRSNVEDLAKEVEKCPCESMDGGETLDIADEAGFVIARFKSGFDSSMCPSQESEENVELDIADENGNVIVRFANGHVYTKRFDSSQSGGGGSSATKKSIKILFLGNSVTQDHATYLPWLLKNTYGEDNIEFAISIFYCGGSFGTIKEYATTIADGGRNAEIFSSVVNTDVWTNETNISLDTALARQTWDVISIQGWANGTNEDVTYIPTLIEKLTAKVNKPFELAYLINQTPSAKPTVLVNTAKQVCRDYSISMIFPPALVTEYARQEWGTEFISPDGGHNREGLPCVMTAYSIMLTLCRRIGLWDAVIGNKLRATAAEIERMKIPGQNGSLVATTDAQYLLAQEFAVKAVNAADAIFNEAKTNCLNNLMN